MWIRYNEITVGPDPNTITEAEGQSLTYWHNRLSARLFHTGRLEGNKWEEGFDIDLDLKGGTDDSPDEVTVKIYNVKDENFFAEGAFVRIKSGYLDYNDDIFSGIIDEIDVGFEGLNRFIKLKCKDKSDLWLSGRLDKTFIWLPYTSRRKIVMDILQNVGIPIGHVWDDQTFLKVGKKFAVTEGMTVKTALDWLADATDSFNSDEWDVTKGSIEGKKMKFYFKMGRFYWLHQNAGSPSGWLLTENTGLYSIRKSPRYTSEGKRDKGGWDWTIKTALIPGIGEDSIIEAQWKRIGWDNYPFTIGNVIGWYRVKEFHYKSSRNEHLIEMKCTATSFTGEDEASHWGKVGEFPSEDFYIDTTKVYDAVEYRNSIIRGKFAKIQLNEIEDSSRTLEKNAKLTED